MPVNNKFTFAISLSVLNHLGRHLYRSFVTVLGEAISNSWDADAKNVWIFIDKEKNSFVIKDDGTGMSKDDFQEKFLNIGYSKREKQGGISLGGRPFIGRKGIGKLALLSCAEKITIMSKVSGGSYIGGIIDNKGLDDAIKESLKPDDYPLGNLNEEIFKPYTAETDEHGTLIYFENIKGGIKNTLDLLKKIVALYFRFSLVDNSFSIYIDGEKITYEHLKSLADKTEFLWNINNLEDPYVTKQLSNLKESKTIKTTEGIQGFIASVEHYKDLNIMNLDEKVGIDLFVNGRLRERDILKHVSKSRVVESYLYGQIHFNELDDNSQEDRFTSSREGVVPDDVKYQEFLKALDVDILKVVIGDWDKWRRKHREDGDSENPTISGKDRKSEELFNVVSKEYILPGDSSNKKKVAGWINDLADDASFNFGSYAECFICENLIRKYIDDKKITISPEARTIITDWQTKEVQNKGKGNISIDIRKVNNDLSYLSMDDLANMVDKVKDPNKDAGLSRDAKEYKPMRDALAHTALLSDAAKSKLASVYENVKSRVRVLLDTVPQEHKV